MSDCEWNPDANAPAVTGEGCTNEATVAVGAGGEWHLCGSCAALPAFRGFSQEPLEPFVEESSPYLRTPMPRLPSEVDRG